MKKVIAISLILASLAVIGFSFTDNKPRERKIILTDKAPKPIGPYSQAVMVDNTLYVAGQVGFTLDGKLDSTTIETEVHQALKNIKAIVEAAGMNMQQVVKSTLYVKDLKNWTKINEVYGQYFQTDPPARETVQIADLPKGAHFEISVIAVK
jgi:2-iminobutanoate/2-iminopropanoate deaminase